MTDIILYTFAGRRENMELQLPFIAQILNQYPQARYHVWNLARRGSDNRWLRRLSGERITVINDLYGSRKPHRRFIDVYLRYTHPAYRDTLFIKIDDDIVFIETDRFPEFLGAVRDNPGTIISADVINNGACAMLKPELAGLSTPLEAYLSVYFGLKSHQYFFDRWSELLDAPIVENQTRNWLSINMIGYTWGTGSMLYQRLIGPKPDIIAGRDCSTMPRMGDEGAANLLPRIILKGFLACHLYYGPQAEQIPEWQVMELRSQYAKIGQQYREGKS